MCGDVGFGKTEVALRAAFVAVQAGRQVAVLVPTTLLAQQHQQTFSDRFADWPVRIQMLSRFRSGRESAETVAALAAGQVDIVIATHRLLHANARFKNLGLVIIDEEHRFGVRDKERLKALRAEVDVLTLTATPIPRTLNMPLTECTQQLEIGFGRRIENSQHDRGAVVRSRDLDLREARANTELRQQFRHGRDQPAEWIRQDFTTLQIRHQGSGTLPKPHDHLALACHETGAEPGTAAVSPDRSR